MAEHINKTDTLNEGRVKLNAAISDSNIAKDKAEQADVKSTQALANSESTQTQLDTIAIEGDSSVEAAQARVDEKGEGHATLKARIDDGFERTSSQLAEIVTITNNSLSVTQFGASPENSPSENDLAFQQAIDSASISGSTVLIPDGIFLYEQFFMRENVKLIGSNKTDLISTLTVNDAYAGTIEARGTVESVNRGITQSINVGDSSLPLSNVDDLVVGDCIQLYESGQPTNILMIIKEIVGNTIITTESIPYSYNYLSTIVRKVNPIKNFEIENISIDKGGTTTPINHIYITFAVNFKVNNIVGFNGGGKVINVDTARDFSVDRIRPSNASSIEPGRGYGVQFVRSTNATINDVVGHNLRHLIDFVGSFNINVTNCFGSDIERSCYSIHGLQSKLIIFDKCHANSCGTAGTIGNLSYGEDNNITFINSIFTKCGAIGISQGSKGVMLLGVKWFDCVGAVDVADGSNIQIDNPYIQGDFSFGIRGGGDSKNITINNLIADVNASTILMFGVNSGKASHVTINNPNIKGNVARAISISNESHNISITNPNIDTIGDFGLYVEGNINVEVKVSSGSIKTIGDYVTRVLSEGVSIIGTDLVGNISFTTGLFKLMNNTIEGNVRVESIADNFIYSNNVGIFTEYSQIPQDNGTSIIRENNIMLA